MIEDWRSMLGGAALAAALILPTLAHGAPAAPPAPPAAPAQSAIDADVKAVKEEAKAAAEEAKAEAKAAAAEARAEADQARREADKARAQYASADDGSWVTKPRQPGAWVRSRPASATSVTRARGDGGGSSWASNARNPASDWELPLTSSAACRCSSRSAPRR